MKTRNILIAAMSFRLAANAQQSNPLLKNEARHAWTVEKGKVTLFVGTSSGNLPLQTEVVL